MLFVSSFWGSVQSFDQATKSELLEFFEFLQNGRGGIPQSDNDITSTYVGFLYLLFADLLIDTELKNNSQYITDYCVIRFVDDIYLFVSFASHASAREKELRTYSLAAAIADRLYHELGVRLNIKSRYFRLPQDEPLLISDVKKVSPSYESAPSEDELNSKPQMLARQIIKEIGRLRNAVEELDPRFGYLEDFNSGEILKEVYNSQVENLLRSAKYNKKLRASFQNLDWSLVLARPKELIILLQIAGLEGELSDFLLSLGESKLSTHQTYLLILLLCQTGFQSESLINQLRKAPSFERIIGYWQDGQLIPPPVGYLGLSIDKSLLIAKLKRAMQIVEQVKLRRLAELRLDYSVALSHLTNEFHAICISLDTASIDARRYDVNDVIRFLGVRNVPLELSNDIRVLFDRRNINQVSHPDQDSSPVSEREYGDFKSHVSQCLFHLLK